MKTIQALAGAAVSLLLGLGFFALVAWEWRSGFVAGSYGGASFAQTPGIAWFLLTLQVAMGFIFGMGAVARWREDSDGQTKRDAADPPMGLFGAVHALGAAGAACIVIALGLWAIWDMGGLVLQTFREGRDDPLTRVIDGTLLCVVVGVFVWLFFTLLAQPLAEYWSPRVRAALAYFRARR